MKAPLIGLLLVLSLTGCQAAALTNTPIGTQKVGSPGTELEFAL